MNPILKWEIENQKAVFQLQLLRDNYCKKSWDNMAEFMDWWKRNDDFNSSKNWETSDTFREFMIQTFGQKAHSERHSRFYIIESRMNMPQDEFLAFVSNISYVDEDGGLF
jgi:hypothetical protein